MRKLVLGIIAVICLDLAFIIYPGANRPAERASVTINSTARQLNSISGPVNEKAASPEDDDSVSGPETANAGDSRPTVVTRSTAMGRKQIAAAPYSSVSKVDGGRSSNLDGRLKPTVITIGNANSVKPFDRRTDSLERLKKDGPDDRSFISSVLPIVKKPYEWIKFLGSKLR